jgi:Pregnancy-associated plasma protein-A/Secretion system C-terminal sorting domain
LSINNKYFFMKNIIFLLIIFAFNATAQKLINCGSNKTSASVLPRGICGDWNVYNSPINLSNTPVKTIRVSIHVFQRRDGSGNLTPQVTQVQNTPPTNNLMLRLSQGGSANADFWWLKGNVETDRFNNAIPMVLPTSSPYVKDTRIRLQIAGFYVWQDDEMWAQSDNFFVSDIGGITMHNYVMAQNSLPQSIKDGTLHLFFPGKQSNNATGGRASDFGNKKWSLFTNFFIEKQANPAAWMSGTIAHEIGHNLNLYHSWSNDGCNDTPDNPNCRRVDAFDTACNQDSKVTNNVMDYGPCQCAFTQCQVLRMHNAILTNIGNLRDIMVETITPTIPTITGANCVSTSGGNYIVSNYQAGTEASWAITPAASVTVSSGCGQVAVITPKAGVTGSITLKYNITWDNGRVTTASKVINIQPATVITGNYYGAASGTLSTNNNIKLGSTNVRVSLANATSYTWTRSSGNATWTGGGSGTFTGSSIDFTLTAANSSAAFTVTATTACGNFSQTFSFSTNSWAFRAAPNPATSVLRISGEQITQPTARTLGAAAPLKFELRLYDKYGQVVKYAKNTSGATDLDLDVSGLPPDIYQLQIFKDNEVTNQRIEIRR